MSINDPIKVEYLEKRGKWVLCQGRESFYDDSNQLREWDTQDQAGQWAIDNLGIRPDMQPASDHESDSGRASGQCPGVGDSGGSLTFQNPPIPTQKDQPIDPWVINSNV